ncbi:hypothetical protein GWN75_22165 [candidate division KSB1 bacterium]|nr:hypothetical protein [candidate division KSB1 bacterium]NIU27169.1 hypothetical protein [candidate division KSB1 bacterium]NIU93352.1 hypothetical protein [candidate division KSB1 bacterium]NIW21059.1 hypothetical protein [candidate division KSB1 bacterium]NIW71616.1 hypothetical protein [candidate division KSB1 bacterium]
MHVGLHAKLHHSLRKRKRFVSHVEAAKDESTVLLNQKDKMIKDKIDVVEQFTEDYSIAYFRRQENFREKQLLFRKRSLFENADS